MKNRPRSLRKTETREFKYGDGERGYIGVNLPFMIYINQSSRRVGLDELYNMETLFGEDQPANGH